MSSAPDQELTELRTVIREFLEAKSAEDDVRRLMETDEGHDPAVWDQLARELGLVGIAIPEQYGGAGAGFVEQAVVLEEMGRALFCGPYLASAVLAARALLESGDADACRDYLPGIADGSLVATVAIADRSGRWDEVGAGCTATPAATGWTVSGTKHYVLDALVAGLVLVFTASPEGPALFAVDRAAVDVRPIPTMDPTRKLAEVVFRDAPARPVGAVGAAGPVLEKVLQYAAAALAAEQAGASRRVLDMAVEYAGTRVQFGRPIGSFQAVKHLCAEMFLQVQCAAETAARAALAAADAPDELPVAASVAKSVCSRAYVDVAAKNIQVHGGIGFTWEHPAHLHFRRSRSSAILFGDPHAHHERLHRLTGLADQLREPVG
ncbi:Acyl-CoA dehydrogenase [Pseudonocardia thermophila]|jgi:Acyl-CoA dehydrogenases|uniref:Acyl-CoA dehydrogenase n=1 Tax=Pseudonocardia thermophila TaxID=1848 RepID=A0A1M6UXV8_PSETH|nr:acyl-CoA dehydrogenase family protein [Pseudonocardia thermophila]SHK74048.1 Acyl-CoA dehydrogenase [Pseudonocardia thermophila]